MNQELEEKKLLLKNLDARISFYRDLDDLLTTDIGKTLQQEFVGMRDAIWEARDTYFTTDKDWLTVDDTAKLMKIKYQTEQMNLILNYLNTEQLKAEVTNLRVLKEEILQELGNSENFPGNENL